MPRPTMSELNALVLNVIRRQDADDKRLTRLEQELPGRHSNVVEMEERIRTLEGYRDAHIQALRELRLETRELDGRADAISQRVDRLEHMHGLDAERTFDDHPVGPHTDDWTDRITRAREVIIDGEVVKSNTTEPRDEDDTPWPGGNPWIDAAAAPAHALMIVGIRTEPDGSIAVLFRDPTA